MKNSRICDLITAKRRDAEREKITIYEDMGYQTWTD